MKISNQNAWQDWVDNNKDFYSKGIIDYAERWANMMEEKMAEGMSLENIAKDTSHEADTDGITGYMYGTAVRVLATSWGYGDQLRRWHNLDMQIGTEGEKANEGNGVLNPALLNIEL